VALNFSVSGRLDTYDSHGLQEGVPPEIAGNSSSSALPSLAPTVTPPVVAGNRESNSSYGLTGLWSALAVKVQANVAAECSSVEVGEDGSRLPSLLASSSCGISVVYSDSAGAVALGSLGG